MTDLSDFTPRWASSPGSTLQDVLDEREVSVSDFAATMDLDEVVVRELLEGRQSITLNLARRLSQSIGSSVEFWMTRDLLYHDDAMRVANDQWANDLPIQSLVKLGWISKPVGWRDRIDACLDFFGVENAADWRRRYEPQLKAAYFRSSGKLSQDPGAVAAWLRQGEKIAEKLAVQRWNRDQFREELQGIRSLTKQPDPAVFLPALSAMCARSGTRFVILRTPPKCPINGVARWLPSGEPCIQMSARYLADDQFWFTFFHEAAHLLLHANEMHIDHEPQGDNQASQKELEANALARDLILDGHSLSALTIQLNVRGLISAAGEIGISPGLLVGQLQHSGSLDYRQMNGLKRRYSWSGSTLERA